MLTLRIDRHSRQISILLRNVPFGSVGALAIEVKSEETG